ncbi:YwdI family protein [Piscibacillus halophilus]|uniref:YwdI family protein n=1 Tax=Piscibacillus halophilus TaxID=571933 RepID=UPI0024096513|nr:YwdI family protein [Piscibacillus halophilus]
MTVSYQAIIRQMKKELEQLNENTDHQQVLAKMHVVKSLADVVINSYEDIGEKPQTAVISSSKKVDMTDAEAKMMGIRKKDSDQGRLLEDDDANGDSIFDF